VVEPSVEPKGSAASQLADVDALLPCYRFATLAAKACELRVLSAGLLAALEKRDLERMARLRSGRVRAITAWATTAGARPGHRPPAGRSDIVTGDPGKSAVVGWPSFGTRHALASGAVSSSHPRALRA